MIFKGGSFAWVCLSFLSFTLIVPYSFFPFVHHSIWFSFGFVHATLPRKRSFCSLLPSSSLSPSSSAVFESWGPSSCTHTTVQIEIDRERASRETTGTLRGWSDSHTHRHTQRDGRTNAFSASGSRSNPFPKWRHPNQQGYENPFSDIQVYARKVPKGLWPWTL